VHLIKGAIILVHVVPPTGGLGTSTYPALHLGLESASDGFGTIIEASAKAVSVKDAAIFISLVSCNLKS